MTCFLKFITKISKQLKLFLNCEKSYKLLPLRLTKYNVHHMYKLIKKVGFKNISPQR